MYKWPTSQYNMFIRIHLLYGKQVGRKYAGVKANGFNRLRFQNGWWIEYCIGYESWYTYVRWGFPLCYSDMATFCLWCCLRHWNFPLTLSCIYTSSTNDVGAVAHADRSISGVMTALTINMAVLALKSYKWCKTKIRSHSTSGFSREHVSSCFDYKGSQWDK